MLSLFFFPSTRSLVRPFNAPRWRSPNPSQAFLSRSDPSSVSSLAHRAGLAREKEERELGTRSFLGSWTKGALLHRLGVGEQKKRAQSEHLLVSVSFVLFRRRVRLFPEHLLLFSRFIEASHLKQPRESRKEPKKDPKLPQSLLTHHARQDVPGHGRRRVRFLRARAARLAHAPVVEEERLRPHARLGERIDLRAPAAGGGAHAHDEDEARALSSESRRLRGSGAAFIAAAAAAAAVLG